MNSEGNPTPPSPNWKLALLAACFINMMIALLGQGLEILFYGEIQPRIVDDVIGAILWTSIYLNFWQWFKQGTD